MRPRQRIDLGAGALRLLGEVEQLADGVDLEAQLPRMANELQPPTAWSSYGRRLLSVRDGDGSSPMLS